MYLCLHGVSSQINVDIIDTAVRTSNFTAFEMFLFPNNSNKLDVDPTPQCSLRQVERIRSLAKEIIQQVVNNCVTFAVSATSSYPVLEFIHLPDYTVT